PWGRGGVGRAADALPGGGGWARRLSRGAAWRAAAVARAGPPGGAAGPAGGGGGRPARPVQAVQDAVGEGCWGALRRRPREGRWWKAGGQACDGNHVTEENTAPSRGSHRAKGGSHGDCGSHHTS